MQYFTEILVRANELKPTIELLCELQTRFVHAGTYNNLEVVLGNISTLLPKNAYQSVVINNEGGTCLTINLAFYHILNTLGFKVHLVAPFVQNYNQMELHNDRPTHMAIIVSIGEQQYLVDPGWGNGSRIPVPLNGEVINHLMGTFRVVSVGDEKIQFQRKFDEWVTQFIFDPNLAMHYNDFQEMLEFIYSDNSMFRKSLFVTKAAPDFSTALVDDKLYTTFPSGDKKIESVDAMGGISQVLVDVFGLSPKYVESVVWAKEKIIEEVWFKLQSKWKIAENADVPLSSSPLAFHRNFKNMNDAKNVDLEKANTPEYKKQ